MKKNIILRLALWLLIAAWLSNTLLGGTVWAKYVAQGKGEGKARAAAFSVEVGSNKPTNPAVVAANGLVTSVASGDFPNQNQLDAWKAQYKTSWDELVINPVSGTAVFELPMFDYAYADCGAGLAISGYTTTVLGANKEMVIAPGTGLARGAPLYNSNLRKDSEAHLHENATGDHNWYVFFLRNNSEVTIRYKLTLLPQPITGLNLYFDCYDTFSDYLGSGTSPILFWDSGDPAMNYEGKVINLNPGQTSTAIYLDYGWDFEIVGTQSEIDAQNAIDTALGKAGTGIVNFPILFEVTQVD